MTKVLVATAVILFALLFVPLIGTIIGSIVGAIVGFFYPNTFFAMFTALGLPQVAALPLWQVGAFLGFVGGFFRATFTSKSGD